MVLLKYQIYMPKINIACFTVLFFLFSCYSRAQTENKIISTEARSADKESVLFNTSKADCINLPFGYSDLSKQRATADTVLPVIQDENKLKEINSLQFEKSIQKDWVSLSEEYDVFLPFNKNINERHNPIKIATKFLCDGKYSLYFMAVYNTVRYADPFIEKIYLISIKDNKPVDMKKNLSSP